MYPEETASPDMAYAKQQAYAQHRAALGSQSNAIREVETPSLEDIARRTAGQLETANEALAVLDGLHCRLFGPRPTTSTAGDQARQTQAGAFDTLRDLKAELSNRLNRICALSHELSTRI